MKWFLGIASLATSLVALLPACTAAGVRPAAAELTELGPSLVPLQAWFDAHRDRPRALALLSPT